MDLHRTDNVLLAGLALAQLSVAIRVSAHRTSVPVLSGYLWIALVGFVPWVLDSGASRSLPWNLFLSGAKILVALEAFHLTLLRVSRPSRFQRSIPLAAITLAVLALSAASPPPYPNFPPVAGFVRVLGHLLAFAVSIAALVFALLRSSGSFPLAHSGLLSVYFLTMVLAWRVSPSQWFPAHITLLSIHLLCMICWFRILSRRVIIVPDGGSV